MFLCRCSNHKCHMRRALTRRPTDYIRPPKCDGCGRRKWKWDRWQEKDNAKKRCNCTGYWFTHRRGSKWCEHARGTVTLQEMMKRYGGDILDHSLLSEDPRVMRDSPKEAPF